MTSKSVIARSGSDEAIQAGHAEAGLLRSARNDGPRGSLPPARRIPLALRGALAFAIIAARSIGARASGRGAASSADIGMADGKPSRSSLANDPRMRGLVYQGLLAAGLVALLWMGWRNAVVNMQARGIPMGFGFWDEIAGFDINQAGFAIAGLFAAVWAVAIGYWKLAKVETRWPAGGGSPATGTGSADPAGPAPS